MSLASWMTQTAYVAALTGIDQWGKPVYGPPVARKVRIEQSRRMVLNARGEEVPSNHRLWCLTEIAITDRVWLPGASTSDVEKSLAPMSVASVSDKAGGRTLFRVEL